MYGRAIRVRGGRAFGVALAAAVVFGFGPAGSARADTFIPLPGGTITRQLADGTTMTVRITGESAKISGSMGDTPRIAMSGPPPWPVWISTARAPQQSDPDQDQPRLYRRLSGGYQRRTEQRCQRRRDERPQQDDPAESVRGPLGDPVAVRGHHPRPGQAVARLILDLEKPDDYGQESHKRYNKVSCPHASVSWQDEAFEVNGCGGYAQARSFVAAEVDTPNFIGNLVLYGEPFSMG